MRWILKLTGLAGLSLSAISAQAQSPTATEVLNYLKQNIKILYLAKPNADTPRIVSINPEGIFLDTDGIIFGQKSNNGMDKCAQILFSLFKTRNSSGKGGDGKLQDAVYQVLKMTGKTVTITFVNDVVEPIQSKYVPQYMFDTTTSQDKLVISSRGFSPDEPTSLGMYITGEATKTDALLPQAFLLYTLMNMGFKDFDTGSYYDLIYSTGDPINPLSLDPGARKKIIYSITNIDIREIVNRGIATGLVYTMNKDLRNLAYSWYPDHDFLVWTAPIVDETRAGKGTVFPEKMSLRYIMNQDNLMRVGYDLNSPPFPVTPGTKNWKGFVMKDLPPKYIINNDIVLGMLCEQFIRKLGLQKFSECMAFSDRRLFTASFEKRLSIFFENLCLGLLNGQSIENVRLNPPKDRLFFMGLSLLDLFLNFPANANADLFNQATGGTISPALQTIYFNEFRDKIKTAAQTAFSNATGNKWDAAVDAIYTLLSK
ncbi:MAG TPA: hypothetical protein VLJ68_00135 [Chitinophagaceae bacterium]|nr:hypothetical protein [Chitinophagaceae bacterium]